MKNIDIRTDAISNGIKHYEIATALGWSDSKLSILLREPLSEENRTLIQGAISQIISKRKE